MEADPSPEDLEARIARARAAGDRAAELRPKHERASRARGAATSRLDDAEAWRRGWFGLRALWFFLPAPSVRAARAALLEARAAEDALHRELAEAEAEARTAPELEARLLDRLHRDGALGGAPGDFDVYAAARASLDGLRSRANDLAALERDLRTALDALETALPSRATGTGSPLRGATAPASIDADAAVAAIERARPALARAAARACAGEVAVPPSSGVARPSGEAFVALAHAARTAFHRAGELLQLAIAEADRAARTRDALRGRLLSELRAHSRGGR